MTRLNPSLRSHSGLDSNVGLRLCCGAVTSLHGIRGLGPLQKRRRLEHRVIGANATVSARSPSLAICKLRRGFVGNSWRVLRRRAPSSAADAQIHRPGEVAPRQMSGRHVPQRRRLLPAAWLGEDTARVETAAGGRGQRARNLAPQGHITCPPARIGHRHRAHQRCGVGMQRMLEQVRGRGQLDQLPQAHDRAAVANMPYHRQVMRHKQKRQLRRWG